METALPFGATQGGRSSVEPCKTRRMGTKRLRGKQKPVRKSSSIRRICSLADQGWAYAMTARRHRYIPFGTSPPGRLQDRARTCIKGRLLMERARGHGNRLIMHLPRRTRPGRRNHRRVGRKRNLPPRSVAVKIFMTYMGSTLPDTLVSIRRR
jgi:hypothetical protein